MASYINHGGIEPRPPSAKKHVPYYVQARKSHGIHICSIILFLSSMTVLGMAVFEVKMHSQAGKNTGAEICTTCLESPCMNPDNLLTLRSEGDTNRLCASLSNSQEFTTLLKVVMATRASERPLTYHNAGNFSSSHASAHRRLVPANWTRLDFPIFSEDGENVRLAHEAIKSGSFDHTRNVNVSKSSMTVLTSGLYHVYSSLGFRPVSAKPCKFFAKQTWEHCVILTKTTTDGQEQRYTLLNESHTCCDDCKYNQAISFSERQFVIEEGDQLHVEVSGQGIVDFYEESSFLGLIFLHKPCKSFP